MRWVGRQPQLMNLFPRSNANVGRIEIRTLLGELMASPFGALIFFVREALGGSLNQVACAGQRHMSGGCVFCSLKVAQPRLPTSRNACEPRYRLHQLLRRRRSFARQAEVEGCAARVRYPGLWREFPVCSPYPLGSPNLSAGIRPECSRESLRHLMFNVTRYTIS